MTTIPVGEYINKQLDYWLRNYLTSEQCSYFHEFCSIFNDDVILNDFNISRKFV